MTENINTELSNVDWENHDSIIEFYERNNLYFNNYDKFTNQDTIIELIKIKLHYTDSLLKKGRNKKAQPILTHVNILLQKIKDHEDIFKEYSEQLLFFNGMVKGNLKNYNESLSIFKELLKIDPYNDNYKEWYLFAKSNLFRKQSGIIEYIGFALIFTGLFADGLFNINYGIHITLIGFILMTIGFATPRIRKLWIKYKKNI